MSEIENLGNSIGETKQKIVDSAANMQQFAADLKEENRTFAEQRTETFQKVKDAVEALQLLAGAVDAGRADAIGAPLSSAGSHLRDALELSLSGGYADSSNTTIQDVALGINGLLRLHASIGEEALPDTTGKAEDMRMLIGRIVSTSQSLELITEQYHNGGVRAAESATDFADVSAVVVERCDEYIAGL